MSDVEDLAEIAADGVADGLHIVSEQALAAEKVVEGFDNMRVAFLGLGLALGGVIGALSAFKVAYAKAEKKYNEIADEEIATMRRHYHDKATAVDQVVAKGDLEELVKERGYSVETDGPMVVKPPGGVVEAAQEKAAEDAASKQQPEERIKDPEVRNVFRDNRVEDHWDEHKERSRRSPIRPYIIHVDERNDQEAYDGVTWTYYEADDVLANERDEVVGMEDRERLVGEVHLSQFGHGSNDAYVVYIRNDQLEMDFEIVKSPGSFAEEVHGFDPTEPELRHSVRRERFFDDDYSG